MDPYICVLISVILICYTAYKIINRDTIVETSRVKAEADAKVKIEEGKNQVKLEEIKLEKAKMKHDQGCKHDYIERDCVTTSHEVRGVIAKHYVYECTDCKDILKQTVEF